MGSVRIPDPDLKSAFSAMRILDPGQRVGTFTGYVRYCFKVLYCNVNKKKFIIQNIQKMYTVPTYNKLF